MNPIFKLICLITCFQASAMAGRLNIVQLGPPDGTRFGIACGGANQEIELPHGGTTGGFILPEKEGTITIPKLEIPALTIPATASPNIAILAPAGDEGFRWKLIPGMPTKEKWAMRVINLSTETAILPQDGNPLEIKPDAITELPVKGKGGMSVLIEGTEKRSYKADEPCAVLAIIYRKDNMWEVLFVPDR